MVKVRRITYRQSYLSQICLLSSLYGHRPLLEGQENVYPSLFTLLNLGKYNSIKFTWSFERNSVSGLCSQSPWYILG